jgi:hypothetical protein
VPNEAEKLPFGGLKCCVWHHVQQANMQLANGLMVGAIFRQDGFPFLL